MSAVAIEKNEPAKPVKVIDESIRGLVLRLIIGFLGLAATTLVVASVRRLMTHAILNSGSIGFEGSVEELYAASERTPTILIVALSIWLVGFFFTGMIAGWKSNQKLAIVACLCGFVFAGWIIPTIIIHGGILGPLALLRMITTIPAIAIGVHFGAVHCHRP